MPEMNGIEATRQIRSLPADVPVVAVSAFTAAEDIEACFQAGMDDYSMMRLTLSLVPKPFKALTLQKALVRWLNGPSS